jgi:hypothetical protein
MTTKRQQVNLEISCFAIAATKTKEAAISCLDNLFIDEAEFIELSHAYLSIERTVLKLTSLSHFYRTDEDMNKELKTFNFDDDDDEND